jgi:hypothetical protein
MAKQAATNNVPEFQIVVKRPATRGPLAPYRFAISVLVTMLVTFDDLRAAVFEDASGDDAMLRAISVAVFTWVVLSILNRILASAPAGGGAGPAAE